MGNVISKKTIRELYIGLARNKMYIEVSKLTLVSKTYRHVKIKEEIDLNKNLDRLIGYWIARYSGREDEIHNRVKEIERYRV